MSWVQDLGLGAAGPPGASTSPSTAAALFGPTTAPVSGQNFNIFQQVYDALFNPFSSAVNGVSSSLTGTATAWIGPGVLAMSLIYLAACALMVNEAPVFPGWIRKVLIPAAVALTVLDAYNKWVVQPATTFAPDIAKALAASLGGTNITGGSPFDTVNNHAYAAGVAVMNALPFSLSGILMGAAVVIYWIIACASVGFAFVLFLVSQIGLLLLLAIGPIFVAFGAFQFTRFLLKGYASAVASLICAQVIVIAILGIAIQLEQNLIDPIMTAGASANPWDQVGHLIVVGVLLVACTVLAFKASAYAVGICGGIFDGVSAWVAAGSMAARGGAAAAEAGGNLATAASRPFRQAGASMSAGGP